MSGILASARAPRPAISFHTILGAYCESVVAVGRGGEGRLKRPFALWNSSLGDADTSSRAVNLKKRGSGNCQLYAKRGDGRVVQVTKKRSSRVLSQGNGVRRGCYSASLHVDVVQR